MVGVRVLGTLEATVDGVAARLPADARARELLGWLAVHPGLHPRSALAGRLRPDVAEESARKTLRDAVYKLRSALGTDGGAALVARRDEIGLVGATVDLHEFRRLRAAGELAAAVELAGGELLPGIDTDWAMRARDEHAADVAACLAELAAAAETGGDLAGAITWTRRRIELEPLGEAAHRDLVRLLALTDDRPAALRAAATLSDRLRRELGVPPSAATRALVDDIRTGRLGAGNAATLPPGAAGPSQGAAASSLSAADAEASAITAAPLPAPLARTAAPEGRELAVAQLQQAWDAAGEGELRLALVAGEAGIGKTTVAGELARRVHSGGAAVLYGRSEERALVPFQPWVELLEGHLSSLPSPLADHWLAVHDGALARLLPARSGRHDGDAAPRDRYLAFEAVAQLVAQAASVRPVLLVLDDLHWADEESLALLRHVTRAALEARVLVVLCARDAELSPAARETVAELRRQTPPAEVPLGGLGVEAVGAVIARHHGGAGAELAPQYRQRTGGNPFFLEALLRDEATPGDAPAGPPPGVRDLVDRRLARLGPATRELLDVAAVLGLEFSLALVAAAAGKTLEEVLEALDGATECGLVEPTGVAGRYAFAHALVSETILQALPTSGLARLHLRVADALAAVGPASPAGEIVRHLRAAAPLVPAERLAQAELGAAREASVGAAPREAAEHYAAVVGTTPPGPGHAEVLLALGHARDRAGQRDEAREAFDKAAELALQFGDIPRLVRAALGFGGIGVVIARADPRTVELLETALAQVPPDDHPTVARLLARLAIELYYADVARAGDLSERAVTTARASGDPSALAAALNARRVALWDPAHVQDRLEVVDEMVRVAAEAGEPEAELQARNWRVGDLWEVRRMVEVRAEIDTYEALADAVGLPHYRWYVPLWRAALAIMAGEWEEGERLGAEALALGEAADDPNARLLLRVQRQGAFVVRRDMATPDRDWSAQQAARAPDPPAWLADVARLDAALGEFERAQQIVSDLTKDGCAAIKPNANWLTGGELAEAAADLGDRDAAAALYDWLLPFAEQYPVVARAVLTENVTEHSLGRLAATLGRWEEAEARLRRAAQWNDEAGMAPFAAATRFHLGEVLLARGETAAAHDVLADARARAERLEMPALVGEVERTLAGAST